MRPELQVVPALGMAAWPEPDPASPIAAHLDRGLEVWLVERRGDWGRVICSDGQSVWVDARLLSDAAPTVGGTDQSTDPATSAPVPPPQPMAPVTTGPRSPGAGAGSWWRSRPVRLAVGFVMVVGGLTTALVSRGGDDADAEADAGEVFLAPSDQAGTDTFTPSVAAPPPPSTVPTATTSPAPSSSGLVQADGDSPGLYGGRRDVPSCDSERLVSFLEGQPAREAAWARALGIDPGEIRAFVGSLTPANLRVDIRVTDYAFAGGRSQPRQSVLEAGTAVLLDRTAFPVVRCASGDPLGQPRAVTTAPRYTGPPWSGFRPSTIVLVRPAPPVPSIVLVDVGTGSVFTRLPGSVVIIDIDRLAPGTTIVIVEPGGRFDIAGTQWPAGTPLQVNFDDPAVALATPTADAAGSFAVNVEAPGDAEPGVHQVVITGGGATVSQTVYLIPPAP